MRHPLSAFLAATLLAVSSPALPAADAPAPVTYKINLSPAYKVGQKYTVVADATQTENSNVSAAPAGSPPQTQTQKTTIVTHLEGETEVLALQPNGGAQKLAVTVKSLTSTTDGQPLPGLPAAGVKIVAERVGTQKKFTVDDKPVDPSLAKVLDTVIDPDSEKRNDQLMFGTETPQPIGGTWQLNGAQMAEGLKEENDVDVSNVTGAFKLDAVTGTGAAQVETVSGNISVGSVKLPLPPGINVDTGTMTSQFTGQIPATTTQGTLKQGMTLSMKVVAHGDAMGMQLKMDVSMDVKTSVTLTFH